MRSMLPVTKAVLLVLTAAFLSACKTKETQQFIFSEYNYAIHEQSYFVADLDNPSYTTKIDTTLCLEGDKFVTWSPNGNYYVCSGTDHQIFFIYDVANNVMIHKSESENSGDMILGKWSPNSQYVSIVNKSSEEKPYVDFSIMKLDGKITQIYKGSASEYFWDSAWSPNGKYLILEITPPYRIGENSRQSILAIYNILGKKVSQFDLPPELIVRPIKWSPDNRKITFTDIFSSSNLYVLDSISGEITNVISDISLCVNDISGWSPDGKKILFSAHDCGILAGTPYYPVYYSINLDGSELRQLSEEGIGGELNWHPDGKFIIITEYGNGILLMDIDGNKKEKLIDTGIFVSWITP